MEGCKIVKKKRNFTNKKERLPATEKILTRRNSVTDSLFIQRIDSKGATLHKDKYFRQWTGLRSVEGAHQEDRWWICSVLVIELER